MTSEHHDLEPRATPARFLDSRCTWKEDSDGIFHTTCGNAHEFTSGGIAHNGYEFCPYCGRAIISFTQVLIDLVKERPSRALSDLEHRAIAWALEEVMHK